MYLNPPFDSRIYTVKFLSSDGSSKALSRGYIEESKQATIKHSGTPYQIRFLYNPSILDLAYAVNGSPPPNNDTLTGPQGLPIGTGQGTMNFSLLFDRTYEKWDSKYAHTTVGTKGVTVDIDAFRSFVNIVPGPGIKGGSNNVAQGFMIPNPAFFHFGGLGSMLFYGYITDLSIEITHWTQDMTPVRCTVGVSVLLQPPGVKVDLTSGSGSPSTPATPKGGGVGGNLPKQIPPRF